MGKIRVLVVDDSFVVRRVVSDVINEDPELEVAGVAINGKMALAKVAELNPAVVTLDVEMPEMDGIQTLTALRKTHPRLPIIMFSTVTERGARVTLEALANGAQDYVTKPTASANLAAAKEEVREQLLPRIKAFCRPPVRPARVVPLAPRAAAVVPAVPPGRRRVIEVVAIGVSTGGPNALMDLVPALPADLPVPVVIVQHMPPVFTRLLAERLASKSALAVREAEAGEPVRPGTVLLAPGGQHLAVERRGAGVETRLTQDPPENSCRPAVDVLFRAAASVYGGGVLAVVLTGMGQDGLRGCEPIRRAGGQVVVQDEATSVVWGMPGAVAQAGLADAVLPLPRIGPEILQRVGAGRIPGRLSG